MYNPFPRYELKYLNAFKQKGVKCFVKQSYPRGKNMLEENPKPAYLLSHYDDKGLALEHLDALKHDNEARILMMNDEADFAELQRLGTKENGAYVYMYFKQQNGEQIARKILDNKLHAYIDYKLGWQVPGGQLVNMKLDYVFGNIYVELRHGTKYAKVKIEEIENPKYVL